MASRRSPPNPAKRMSPPSNPAQPMSPPSNPSHSPEYEKLFLMEVFLDSVYISTANIELDPSMKSKLKETCVMFQFLDYPPLVLCEEDFVTSPPRRSATEDVDLTFKSGKSCMFSVRSSLIPDLPFSFKVYVSILRKLEDNGGSRKISIGTASIELGDSVAALMHSSVAQTDLPLSKTKQGTFDILSESNKKIGAITGLIRVSCFGQLIVTQFQVGAQDDAFMFKGTDTKEVEQIPGDSSQAPKIEVDPNYVPPPPEMEVPEDQQSPYGDGTDIPYSYPPPYYPDEEELGPPQPPEEPGNYKEIVAEIRGHSLHIRIPMKPKKEKEICKKQLVEDMEGGPVCKFAPPLNLCDCDYPVPPEAIPRCPPRCCQD